MQGAFLKKGPRFFLICISIDSIPLFFLLWRWMLKERGGKSIAKEEEEEEEEGKKNGPSYLELQ